MRRLSSASRLAAVLLLAAASTACGPSTPPPDSPEKAEAKEGGDKPDKPASGDAADAPKDTAAPEEAASATVAAVPPPPKVDSSMSLDTYEMTPSDCEALGQHYGEVARSDQMVELSPKLSEKQRASVAAQVDKVVGKLQQSWTDGCHTSLENKAVDHAGIKCALGARTVKEFDVCINGPGGTSQPAAPSGKKKK